MHMHMYVYMHINAGTTWLYICIYVYEYKRWYHDSTILMCIYAHEYKRWYHTRYTYVYMYMNINAGTLFHSTRHMRDMSNISSWFEIADVYCMCMNINDGTTTRLYLCVYMHMNINAGTTTRLYLCIYVHEYKRWYHDSTIHMYICTWI